MRRFLPAILLVLFILTTAPLMGVVRREIFEAFPDGALFAVVGMLALGALGALGMAVARIRHHRLLRYGGLVVVGILVWIQNFGFSDEVLEVNVVEKIHILEYGLLAWLLYRALRPADTTHPSDAVSDLSRLLLPLLGVVLAGTLDEWVQWLAATRMGHLHDIWLNLFAGLCGLLFAVCLEPPTPFVTEVRDGPGLGRVAAVVGFGLGLFYSEVALGHLISDPEVGEFRSWHTREELLRLSKERAQRWAIDPPGELSPWQLEDRYLSEAGWHANFRDRARHRGQLRLAWHNNKILEKYFAPYLDLENFRRRGKRRYPPNILQQLEAAAAEHSPEDGIYRSPVLQKRIRTWPSRTLFLAMISPAVLLLWWLPHFLTHLSRS